VLLAPIGIIALCRGDFIRAILSGAVLLLVTGLAYSWLAGPHTFDALAYHADRPIQIESPYGATLVIVDYFRPDLLSFVYSYGSWNIAASFEPPLRILSFALTLVALISVYVVYARGMARLGTLQSDSDDVGVAFTFSAMIAALIAFITLGKVFSPQYLTWLFPIGAITAASASKRSRALLFAGLAVAQVEYPYFPLLTGALVQPLFGAVALLRATLLIAAAASLMADFYPRKINLAPLRRERGLVAQNE
jgi:hypothetical protein